MVACFCLGFLEITTGFVGVVAPDGAEIVLRTLIITFVLEVCPWALMVNVLL